MQSKVKKSIFTGEKVEDFPEFIFVGDQYLFIFAEFAALGFGRNPQNKFRKKKFRINFFHKQFLPLRY